MDGRGIQRAGNVDPEKARVEAHEATVLSSIIYHPGGGPLMVPADRRRVPILASEAVLRGDPMAAAVQTFTDSNWDSDVLHSSTPVLVDFWADWCVPCKALALTVEAVASQFGGKLKVGKINVEDNTDVPFRYNITTLPTLLVFGGGKVLEQRVGLISKDNLVKLLEPHLG